LPFIQCHQTRGLALFGGSSNCASRLEALCAETVGIVVGAAARIATTGMNRRACRGIGWLKKGLLLLADCLG
jgi:class 3 adenylate cyclase